MLRNKFNFVHGDLIQFKVVGCCGLDLVCCLLSIASPLASIRKKIIDVSKGINKKLKRIFTDVLFNLYLEEEKYNVKTRLND